MRSRPRIARSIILLLAVAPAAAFVLTSEPVRGTEVGPARLVSFDPAPESEGDICEYVPDGQTDVGDFPTAESSEVAAFQGQPASTGAKCGTVGCAEITARPPVRYIQDAYTSFSAVAVDPTRNEVVVADENRFRIFVYDRLANTPASARMTEPKRMIGGLKTRTQYTSAIYVDPKNGDIYAVNNDTVHDLTVFSRQAQGDVPPDRVLTTPYGSFGIAVDEEKQEVFIPVQHDCAVTVWSKMGRGDEPPLRLLQGDRTHLADPHGIALDPKNKLIFVTNFGTSRQALQGSLAPNGSPRIPNWPAGNTMPYQYRPEVVLGTGKFGPPSITVFSTDAQGNQAPLRVIEGPKTQLSWPTGIAVDPDRGELYVANDTGDSIAVFSAASRGDVAPIRVLKGPRTLLKNPLGVSLDFANDELWVANFGNHTATVYKRTAAGDTAPLRLIRSAPSDAPATEISNPFSIAYDPAREEVLVPN